MKQYLDIIDTMDTYFKKALGEIRALVQSDAFGQLKPDEQRVLFLTKIAHAFDWDDINARST